ncbi:hypothetical protein PRIPAC_88699 [Pristionchus pacificus]|uniref:Uncharacterized protein n=1 Tax=Pristionchus pacificus TaxID=54126 RepID=A0A2A6B8S7_PRIPA|nr:hypothetical protein PRIPAC_88699 [Pristionchus pacificus]|eukprot:PDM62290.1 hypothetical protein PRIPAC_51732 [Pristionchus pacificus]
MDITLESGLRIVRDAMEHLRVANLTLSGLKRIDSDSASIILDIIRNTKNTMEWLSLQDEGSSILMNNFRVVQPLLAEASALIPRVDFVLRDKKLRYERLHWEQIHNSLKMRNSKILIFEALGSRTVRFESVN